VARVFLYRFFQTSQFKRSAIPNGPKVGSGRLALPARRLARAERLGGRRLARGAGLINGIREFRPPHYHIAVYPSQYRVYAEERQALEAATVALAMEEAAALKALETAASTLARVDESPSVSGPDRDAEGRSIRMAAIALGIGVPVGLGYLVRRRRN
jgi:hypothetical protein